MAHDYCSCFNTIPDSSLTGSWLSLTCSKLSSVSATTERKPPGTQGSRLMHLPAALSVKEGNYTGRTKLCSSRNYTDKMSLLEALADTHTHTRDHAQSHIYSQMDIYAVQVHTQSPGLDWVSGRSVSNRLSVLQPASQKVLNRRVKTAPTSCHSSKNPAFSLSDSCET